jgi:ComF family protein
MSRIIISKIVNRLQYNGVQTVKNTISIMTIEHIISMVAPHYCAICDVAGKPLCEACLNEFIEARKPTCHLCNLATDGTLFCVSCLARKPLANAWSVSNYEQLLKSIIQQYKFEHRRCTFKPLAELLHQILPQFPSETLVTYVPTAPNRVRQRGFDHAKLIAKELARIRKLRLAAPLNRTNNSRQVGASRAERIKQAKSLFNVKNQAVEPLPYLLIDDVMTTGATIDAAANLLLQAGATRVYAAVVTNETLQKPKHGTI